ncbi:poly-gamma-glutamate biosynthesis/capsule biosynthesis protein [Plesiocystis pacifica SIR-1]|uniref:Poly-gamma-glutamate biosynthesis/capsule biosynthesis protein n=1 Tax=Plesiocystis pacifica SIR-1 TaxID=391625 RepID=A6GGW6_9BACT|nr:CapA family protein [Plesiocystis pacifica]EDM74907.1 poly-gamma-glutamate biosynthesis/capsule biosynthesis protein [Plesiocystis pacifica SIR-1]
MPTPRSTRSLALASLFLGGVALFPQSSFAYGFDDVEDDYQLLYLSTAVALEGRVVDEDGLAITGASIELIAFGDSLDNDGEGASTGADGGFEVAGLARRSALVKISSPGYYTEILPVNLHVEIDEPEVDLGTITLIEQELGRARLTFGGDTMFDRRMYEKGMLNAATLGSDTRALFQFIEDVLKADDHTAINLETPVTDDLSTPHPNKSYVFAAHPDTVAELPGLGVDSVALGNNHIFDQLDGGVADTIHHLDAIGLPYYGAGADRYAARATAYSAMVGYSETLGDNVPVTMQSFSNSIGSSYGVGLENIALFDIKGGALPSYSTELDHFAQNAPAGSLAVPIIHGGTEYAYAQSSGTRTDFERVIQEGADLVIGHHPHVVHGVGTYATTDDPVFVVGSLGNLVFDQDVYETFRSYMAVVDVVDTGSKVEVERMQLVPIRLDAYAPRLLAGTQLARLGRHVGHLSTMEAQGATDPNWGSATVFAENGRLVVVPTEADATTTDELDQRLVPLSGGSTGTLDFAPNTDTDALASLRSDVPASCEVGRDLLVIGDFEDGDVDDEYLESGKWVTSGSRYVQGSETHSGTGAAVLLRKSSYSSRTALWMGNSIKVDSSQPMTFRGFVKGDNAGEFEVTVRWMTSSGSSISYKTVFEIKPGSSATEGLTYDWTEFAADLTPPANAEKLKVYFRHYPPAGGGDAEVFLDDVSFIAWDTETINVDSSGTDLPTPNAWDFVRCDAAGSSLDLSMTHRTYESQ